MPADGEGGFFAKGMHSYGACPEERRSPAKRHGKPERRPANAQGADMTDGKITADALRFWIRKRGLTQGRLAEKSGLAQNYISQIHTGARAGSLEAIQQLAAALDVSLPEFFACKDPETPDTVFIKKVKARPRAGTGGLETDGEAAGLYSFHSSFIRRKRGTPEDMVIFEVAGDSMSPTLTDGDLIMINTQDRDARTGLVYLLRLGRGEDSELMVKRLERRPGNILLLRSDNPDYEDIPAAMDGAEGEIEIFGRMVWSCREY